MKKERNRRECQEPETRYDQFTRTFRKRARAAEMSSLRSPNSNSRTEDTFTWAMRCTRAEGSETRHQRPFWLRSRRAAEEIFLSNKQTILRN